MYSFVTIICFIETAAQIHNAQTRKKRHQYFSTLMKKGKITIRLHCKKIENERKGKEKRIILIPKQMCSPKT